MTDHTQERPEPGLTRPSRSLAYARGVGKAFQIVAMLCFLSLFALVTIKYSPFNPDKIPVGENHPAVGQSLHALSLVPLAGTNAGLTLSDLTGRITLIYFWASESPECRKEFPAIRALFEELSTHPEFLLLSVSCSGKSSENIEELRAETTNFLNAFSPDFPTYADPQFLTRGEINRLARLERYPASILLDRDRKIRAVWVGHWSGIEKEIRWAIQKLLAESKNPPKTAATPSAQAVSETR